MKKLDLKLDNIKEMLSKEQMKKITGGDGCFSGYCAPGASLPYWICVDVEGNYIVAASCVSSNPWPTGENGYLYAPANPPYSMEDRYCMPTYCSF